MATETKKVLAQLAPTAATLTDFYTVGIGKQSVVSTISVCNTGSFVANFRISVAQSGAADNIKQYIYYDVLIVGLDTFTTTLGMTLDAGDVVRVYSNNGSLTFNMFGIEVS